MYKNYKIVVNTAAGRRRYMQYLIPFVVGCDLVDRYDIWVNTHNGADIEFFKRCANCYPKINLVWQPDGVVNGIASINAFYRKCCDEDTIYFKLDDDIVWMEPDLIEKMVEFRIANPHYFVVSPLVINNALSTYLLQIDEKISLTRYFNSSASSIVLWKSGKFAADLHKWFFEGYLQTGRYEELYVGLKEMGMCRFSINCILWFGKDLKKIGGVIPGDDEEFMSCIYPTKLGKSNAWNGDAIMAHFAFYPQRVELDQMKILDQYGKFLHTEWAKTEKMRNIDETIQKMKKEIDSNEDKYMTMPSPYKYGEKKKVPFKSKILKLFPKDFQTIISEMYLTHLSKKLTFITK